MRGAGSGPEYDVGACRPCGHALVLGRATWKSQKRRRACKAGKDRPMLLGNPTAGGVEHTAPTGTGSLEARTWRMLKRLALIHFSSIFPMNMEGVMTTALAYPFTRY